MNGILMIAGGTSESNRAIDGERPPKPASKPLPESKLPHHFGWVAVLAVDGLVHSTHFSRGNLSRQSIERGLDLRPALNRLAANQRNGLVGREVVSIVIERH